MKRNHSKITLATLLAGSLITVTVAAVQAAPNQSCCAGDAAACPCAVAGQTPANESAAAGALDERTRNSLYQALADERGGVAHYNAILKKFGQVRPFTNLARAEERHAAALIAVMKRYGMPLPAPSKETPAVPATLKAACEEGVELEKLNIKMYDGFLGWVEEADIRAVFTNLRNASANNHLPALQNCAANDGRGGEGRGRGKGAGRGRGR